MRWSWCSSPTSKRLVPVSFDQDVWEGAHEAEWSSHWGEDREVVGLFPALGSISSSLHPISPGMGGGRMTYFY